MAYRTLTADIVSPATEQHPFGGTGMHIRGQGGTHAVFAVFTVARVKHAVLGDKTSGSQVPLSPRFLIAH